MSAASAGRNAGSTFTVQLPVRAAVSGHRDEVKWTPQRDWPTLAGVRVLVVDDEADARELVRVVLETTGAHVTTAESAGEALHAFTSRSFDLVVADIAMPERDGYWLIRAIRDLPAQYGGEVPAIAVTAYASIRDRDQAIDAGFNLHLAKPVEPEQLVAAVGSAAGSGRQSPTDV